MWRKERKAGIDLQGLVGIQRDERSSVSEQILRVSNSLTDRCKLKKFQTIFFKKGENLYSSIHEKPEHQTREQNYLVYKILSADKSCVTAMIHRQFFGRFTTRVIVPKPKPLRLDPAI